MITAPYMTDYFNDIRAEFLDKDSYNHEMYSFSLGALDAPECIAAGSHHSRYGFKMPSSVSRATEDNFGRAV